MDNEIFMSSKVYLNTGACENVSFFNYFKILAFSMLEIVMSDRSVSEKCLLG